MSLEITNACVQCGACEWECPAEAISPGSEGPRINAARCTECWGFYGDSQCAVVCPVSAIRLANLEGLEILEARYGEVAPRRAPSDTWAWRRFALSEGSIS